MSMSANNLWKGIPMRDAAPQREDCIGCGIEGLDAVKHAAVCVDCGKALARCPECVASDYWPTCTDCFRRGA